jgi:sodium transport system permease protein
LRESLRDRRTLAVTILFPLFVYPLITLLLSQVGLQRQQRSEGQPARVALLGPPALAPDVTAALTKTAAGEKPIRLAKGDERALKAGAVDVIVSFAERNDPAKSAAIHADLLYDETREESVRAKEIVETRLERAPTGCPARFQTDARSVAAQRDVGGYLLAKGLPVFVVMMVMLGAFYPAIDTTAGERERQTLETLLVAPVPPRWLLGGKLAAVTAIAAIAGLLHVSSIALTLGQALRMAGFSGFVVPWARLLGVLALIPLAALTFSALLMAVASFGRTSREAQSFVTPVYLLGLIPSLLVGAGEWPLTPALGAVPIANLTLAARALLSGRWTAAALGTVAATTAVYAGLAVLWAERSFRPALWLARDGAPRESKSGARRDDETSSGHRDHRASPAATLPFTPAQSLGLFAMAFVVLYFVAVPLQRRELISGLLISEWLGIAGLTAAFLRLSRHPFAFTTRLRWPGGKALLGAALVGASAWLVVGLLTEWLIPVPKEVVESLRRAIRPDDHSRSLAFSLFLMALTPAVCEELLFRGALLRGFLPLGRWPALLLTGTLFGLFHVDVWRLFPTALLGVVLSWLAFRADSLWASMLAHFINNGALVALAHLGVDEAPEKARAPLQAAAFTAALVVCGIGVFLVESTGRRRDGHRDDPQMGRAQS